MALDRVSHGPRNITLVPLQHVDDLDHPPETFLRWIAGGAAHKAGLPRDPRATQRMIYDSCKGSRHFKEELRLPAKLERSLRRLDGNIRGEEQEPNGIADALETTRRRDRTILCVDADALYASVEQLDDPTLQGKAFAVVRSVVEAASYESRKYGVRSGMAIYVARRLCPQLRLVFARYDLYDEASKRIMSVLETYGPNMQRTSIDEAFLDITDHLTATGRTAEQVAAEIRARVLDGYGLTVSVGAGPCKLIAKAASDRHKPNGQCIVQLDRKSAMDFMGPLSIRKVHGVGRATELELNALGVETVDDIWRLRGILSLIYGHRTLRWLLSNYLGVNTVVVKPSSRSERTGVGHRRSFPAISSTSALLELLEKIAGTLGARLKAGQWSGRTLTLTLKLDNFRTRSRARTTKCQMSSMTQLRNLAFKLLLELIWDARRHREHLRVPTLGLRLTNLRDESPCAKRQRAANGRIDDWARPISRDKTLPSIEMIKVTDSGEFVTLCPACERDWHSGAC